MATLDLLGRVTHHFQEIVVGLKDGAVHLELDHGLRLADRFHLAGIVGVGQLLLGDVGSVFDDLEGLAVEIVDGVIGRLDPDFPPAFADTLEFVGNILAAVQLCLATFRCFSRYRPPRRRGHFLRSTARRI